MWRALEGDAIVAEVAVGVVKRDAAKDLGRLLFDEGDVRGAGEDRRVVDVAHAHVHGLGSGGGGVVLDLVLEGVGGHVEVGAVVRTLRPVEVV